MRSKHLHSQLAYLDTVWGRKLRAEAIELLLQARNRRVLAQVVLGHLDDNLADGTRRLLHTALLVLHLKSLDGLHEALRCRGAERELAAECVGLLVVFDPLDDLGQIGAHNEHALDQ